METKIVSLRSENTNKFYKYNILILIVASGSFAVYNLLVDIYLGAIVDFVFSVMLTIAYLLYTIRRFLLSKIISLGTLNLGLCIFAFFYPKDVHLNLVFIPIIALTLTVFNEKEKVARNILTTLGLILFTLTAVIDNDPWVLEKMSAEDAAIAFHVNLFTAIILTTLIVFFLVHMAASIDQQLIQITKDLQIKNDELERERSNLNLVEMSQQKILAEKLQTEIDAKNKELTTFTLNLIQKNELLIKLKAFVIESRNIPDHKLRSELNSLLNSINFSFNLDKDWKKFKTYFDQVNQGFFDNLRDTYPHLSVSDVKLCALIRLNLDTKEIAAILDISPESAKLARHRLRKKLSLPQGENLNATLAQI